MIYINGELLNVNNTDEKYELREEVKEFKAKQNQLSSEYGRVVTILSQRRPYPDPNTKILITVPTIGLTMQSITVENGVRKEWVYSSTPLVKKDGKLKIEEPTMLVKNNGELYLDLDQDIELAYFLIFKSGQIGVSDDENKQFFIHNKKRISKSTAAARKKEARLLSVVYEELKDVDVRTLAKRYGISNTNTNTDSSEVRNMLYDRVLANEELVKKGTEGVSGIDQFLKDSNIDIKVQIGALLQDAIDAQIVNWNKRERRWEIDYKDGNTPYGLMEVSLSGINNPNEALLDYLFSDEEALERVKSVIGADDLKQEITREMILAEGRPPVLRKWAKMMFDWKAPQGMGKQELQEEMLKKLDFKISNS